MRFAINDPPRNAAEGVFNRASSNTYAGSPGLTGLGRHYEAEVCCIGDVHPTYSYLIDIKDVDRAVRSVLVPAIEAEIARPTGSDPASILKQAMPALNDRLSGVLERVRWRLSPFISVEVHMRDTGTVLLREKFDFAASHRLHVPSLSMEENIRIFGKCTHPSGHGHNYQVETSVALKSGHGAPTFTTHELEQIVEREIIARFDHKYLNIDTPEFGPGGLNPSVENIARVCFDLVNAAMKRDAKHAELRSITVWESDRTSATYPAV